MQTLPMESGYVTFNIDQHRLDEARRLMRVPADPLEESDRELEAILIELDQMPVEQA
ncbi:MULTISPECIES: hypothetical protein [unclassified Beijerinckia]|uniref:hypothetical protein n=1 Tax=unclassified Beijerinckia TaxID=2638183 RepID=UPI0008999C83|nr:MULTISPECIES: hypothetical protein [unclassified Beijerinckia]MDH7795808.1 hypothetical protein [Beijerinckia sp. GAS462]SEC17265.1 hypothetical protein SAMN05443249_2086 [Beijerinckia sp. 28-YEA-48]